MTTTTHQNYLKKELYELIKKDEKIFDFIQDSSLDGLWYWDIENPENEWMNPKFWTVLGYNPEEMPHKAASWQNIINQDDLKIALENVEKHFKNPEYPYDQIVRYTHKNGSIVWIRCRGIAIRDENGKPVRMLGAHHDITESMSSLELNRSMAEMLDVAPNSIIVNDPDGKCLYANQHAIEIHGYTVEEFMAINLYELDVPASASLIAERIDKINKNGFATFEVEHFKKNKSTFPLEVYVKKVVWKDKPALLSIGIDISWRKEAESKIKTTEIQLEQIDSSSQDSIYAYDTRSRFTHANRALCRLIGLSREEIIGKTHEELGFPQSQCEEWAELHKEVYTSGQTVIRETATPIKGNQMMFFEVILNPIFDTKGVIIGISGITRDITPRKLSEIELLKAKERAEESERLLMLKNEEYESVNEELTQINEELHLSKVRAEESDRLKTAFLQNMSHEIRTPMNAIMGFSGLLLKNFNNREKIESFVKIIELRSNDLLDIINDILDISKIESGQSSVEIDSLKLSDLFNELGLFFNDFKVRINKQHVGLEFRLLPEETLCCINTDKLKLKQILINLISNALKFTETGSVICGFTEEDDKLRFYVTDTGVGIPADKFQFIFERFTQLKHPSERNLGGTGLGLSIVKGLVKLLGGNVWLESNVNKGTTFYFTINYFKSSRQGYHKPSIEIEPKIVTDKTILIVEDDYFNAEYLKEVLSKISMNIVTVQTGLSAVKKIQEESVDLILMDVRLPDISGYEATRMILNHNPGMKIVAQTAYAGSIEHQKALDSGCIDYISKPIREPQLIKLLAKYLK